VALVVGATLEPARSLTMTLGFSGVAQAVGRVGRLALAASSPLVPRRGAVVRLTPDSRIVLVVGHD
jgi:hypothetical protein